MRRFLFSGLLLTLLSASAPGKALADTNVPLDSAEWQILKYSDIPANEIRFLEDSIQISVRQSAGALVIPVSPSGSIRSLRVVADISGELSLAGRRQGTDGADDFLLRIGLILSGDKTMNPVQKWLAPEWVLKIRQSFPPETGLDKIVCHNIVSDPSVRGRTRRHPASSLFLEYFDLPPPENGHFEATIPVPADADIAGLWISTDGDDTGSFFKVTIKQIQFIEGSRREPTE